jgi:hypothetical protein
MDISRKMFRLKIFLHNVVYTCINICSEIKSYIFSEVRYVIYTCPMQESISYLIKESCEEEKKCII